MFVFLTCREDDDKYWKGTIFCARSERGIMQRSSVDTEWNEEYPLGKKFQPQDEGRN